jgi:LysM repeat protein
MTSHKGRHRRPSRTGTAVAAAGTGLAATAIIASAGTASASILPAPSDLPAASSSEHLPVRAVAGTIRAAQPLTVTVQSGQTLSEIAKDRCGNPADWTGIFVANKGKVKDYNLIYPGQVLTVACKTAYVPQPVAVTRAVTYAPRRSPVRQAAVQRPESNVSTAGMGGFQSCVIRAESGGRTQVMNSSGHYGLYQFSASTWAGHGGNPADFGKASAAEQTQVFWNTVHDDGTSDWAPYDGC